MDTPALIRLMLDRHGEEVPGAIDKVSRHQASVLSRGTVSALTSTSGEDCAFLYLLVRYFDRQHVFDVGTNIGCTAVVMNEAARRNGGVLTTCDPVDYQAVPPWSGIRYFHAPAHAALYQLRAEACTIDMVFFDWQPDEASCGFLRSLLDGHAILATHDYEGAGSKGRDTREILTRAGLCDGKTWFVPASERTCYGETAINNSTAVCIPNVLIAALAAGPASARICPPAPSPVLAPH